MRKIAQQWLNSIEIGRTRTFERRLSRLLMLLLFSEVGAQLPHLFADQEG